MSVSTSNQDYCICDQQDRSDGSVVGSEGKLKSTLSKTNSNETYLTTVDQEEENEPSYVNNKVIQNSSLSSTFAELDKRQANTSPPSYSSSSSSSSLLPSRASSERHSNESIIAEQPISSVVLPRLQIPSPTKPAPKKSASFSCMKTAPLTNFYVNQPYYIHPHVPLHIPGSSSRVPSRELKKGCSRITRSKSNLSLLKKSPRRHEFEFSRINFIPFHHPPAHHHIHHPHDLHASTSFLPAPTIVGPQHDHALRRNPSALHQYPLCVTCLRKSRDGSSSFKLRKDFILEMQEERMKIQELMNRKKLRKHQKSNEKLALIAILLINVAFFISFCFLGMMFLRSVRLPTKE